MLLHSLLHTWRKPCHSGGTHRVFPHHPGGSAHGGSCGPSSWSAAGRWGRRTASRPSGTAGGGWGGRRRGRPSRMSRRRGSSSPGSGWDSRAAEGRNTQDNNTLWSLDGKCFLLLYKDKKKCISVSTMQVHKDICAWFVQALRVTTGAKHFSTLIHMLDQLLPTTSEVCICSHGVYVTENMQGSVGGGLLARCFSNWGPVPNAGMEFTGPWTIYCTWTYGQM